MKKNKLNRNIAWAFGANSWAGDVGNGGVSVVCRDRNGAITSAEILDIYEGRERFQKTYVSSGLDIDTQIQLAQLKLVRHTSYLTKLQDEISKVKANMVFIRVGNEVLPTNDAFPVIIKKGCKFEQLANYTADNEALVSQEIYDQLDNLNKAALYLHEAVYALRRSSGDKDSQKSRKMVAELLASNSNQGVIDQLAKGTTTGGNPKTCGTQGTVDERIQDCSSSKGGFVLVARTESGKEVYKELKTGLLWSDSLPYSMSYYDAQGACNSGLEEFAEISGVTWRLPSIYEYKKADEDGIRKALPNMNSWFWSSSVYRYYSDNSYGAWLFNGHSGSTGDVGRDSNYSVRCVAR